MKVSIASLFLLLALTNIGCFSTVPKKSTVAGQKILNVAGKVLREDQFRTGGTLVILPFKAGENARATSQLDRVSLMIVKGLLDYLADEKTPFTVLTTQDQGTPDIIIDGYINNFSQPGKMKRWVMQGRKTILEVNGYMEMTGSKERIFIF